MILLIVGGGLFYMRTSPRFEITHVGVQGNSQIAAKELVRYLQIQPHTNIFQLGLNDLQTRLEAIPWIKSVKVFRNFPDKISIDLTERTPFALVKLDKLHFVAGDGVLLGALTSGNSITLPIITGSFVEQLDLNGENLKFRQALSALQELMNNSLPIFKNIRKIQIQSLENATLINSDPSWPEVRVSLVNYNENVQRLQRVYPRLHLNELAAIDLRFERRVIVKSNKKS